MTSKEELHIYAQIYAQIADNYFKELTMATQPTKTRKDDSLAELLRVVNELRAEVKKTHEILTADKSTEEIPVLSRISDMKFGHTFRRVNGMYCMRCRPTSYLLNSTLVSESLANGKQLIMNVQEGTVFFVENEEVGNKNPV